MHRINLCLPLSKKVCLGKKDFQNLLKRLQEPRSLSKLSLVLDRFGNNISQQVFEQLKKLNKYVWADLATLQDVI